MRKQWAKQVPVSEIGKECLFSDPRCGCSCPVCADGNWRQLRHALRTVWSSVADRPRRHMIYASRCRLAFRPVTAHPPVEDLGDDERDNHDRR